MITQDTPEQSNTLYEESFDGVLQYHADLSLLYKEQARTAKTKLKRDFYQKKLVKNNKKLWRLLVRTPNSYNPLMQYLNPEAATETPEAAATTDSIPEAE